ncbi:MAG: cyclic nucleotide-binding domain-containing protein, partial [Anaerolineae bacterium]
VTLLRRMPLFGELDGRQIQRLAASLEEIRYQAGDLIIGQGDLGDTFYIVLSGRVQVFVTEGDREQTLRQSGPGEIFGEIALLQRVPRTASVRAVTPVELLALRQEAFDRLIREQVLVSRNLEL